MAAGAGRRRCASPRAPRGYTYAPQPKATLQSASHCRRGPALDARHPLQATADRTRAASLFATAGWRDDAWRGRVRRGRSSGALDLRLLTPASLVVGPHGVEFGPAQFGLQHVRFDDVRLRSDKTGTTTQGQLQRPAADAVPRFPSRAAGTG